MTDVGSEGRIMAATENVPTRDERRDELIHDPIVQEIVDTHTAEIVTLYEAELQEHRLHTEPIDFAKMDRRERWRWIIVGALAVLAVAVLALFLVGLWVLS